MGFNWDLGWILGDWIPPERSGGVGIYGDIFVGVGIDARYNYGIHKIYPIFDGYSGSGM
jgi:hypothetical protein